MAIADRLESKLAVNPFGEVVHVDKKPENISSIAIESLEDSKKVNEIFKTYQKFITPKDDTFNHFLSKQKIAILSPLEIEMLMQKIIKRTDIKKEIILTGVLMSYVIQKSYKAGNNNFGIRINDYYMSSLFSSVKGTAKNPVIAFIFGDAGSLFGINSKYCAFDIKGNTRGFFGINSNHCNYSLMGNAGRNCGMNSEYCTYDIMGNAGSFLGGLSKHSVYNVNGNVDDQLGKNSSCCTYNIRGKIKTISDDIKDSTFKVYYRESYNLLCETLDSSNKIQLVDKNENIIMEKKKNNGNSRLVRK